MTFRFGVAAGDVTSSSVVLWTRVSAGREVEWELEPEGAPAPTAGVASADSAGFVHVPLDGLEPGQCWRYRFVCNGVRSRWGRFRTLPKSGPVRFAVVSCAKFNSGYFNAYSAISERDDLDFVLHLGDYIYEAGQTPRGRQTPGIDIGRPFDPLHDCVALDDYHRRYAQYRLDEDLQALHAAHAVVFTLDDHEIADNAWSGGAEEHFPDDGPWEVRLRDALRAWEAWQPTNRRPSRGESLWQVVTLGDVGELFLCDSRLGRTDPLAPDGPKKSMLGVRQAQDLVSTLSASRVPWFVLGMPSKFLTLEVDQVDEKTDTVRRTLKLVDSDGAPYHDRWDSFGHERDRLLGHLQEAHGTPVVLCGDVHFAAFSRTGSGEREVFECVTTSVTSANFDDKMGWAPGGKSKPYEEAFVRSVPELEWCDLDRHGYLIVDISQDSFTSEWWGVDTVRQRSRGTDLLHRVDLAAPQE